MSSTGRGGSRRLKDYYPTPQDPAETLVALLRLDPYARILEPSAGSGAIVRALGRRFPEATIDACEPFASDYPDLAGARYNRLYVRRFERLMLPDTDGPYDAIVGNPPYTHSRLHVDHALYLVRPGGIVAFLLGQGFLYSQGRAEWQEGHPAWFEYGLRERISFTADGKGDSVYNDVVIWQRGYRGHTYRDYISHRPGPQRQRDLARVLARDWPLWGPS